MTKIETEVKSVTHTKTLYRLELNETEALFLYTVLANVGGPVSGARGIATDVLEELTEAYADLYGGKDMGIDDKVTDLQLRMTRSAGGIFFD